MNLLAIETSSDLFSAALRVENRTSQDEELITHHSSERVLPIIQKLLNNENISLNSLDALVLGAGPGSFTGLRIGSSVIQAFAFACNLPVILVSSLRAMAQTAFERFNISHALVAVNAFQQEIYWAGYEINRDNLMQVVIPDSLCSPESISFSSKLESNSISWVGIGNGWEVYKNLRLQCANLIRIQPECYPTASALLKLGEAAFLQKQFVYAQDAVPVYLRNEEAWKKNICPASQALLRDSL